MPQKIVVCFELLGKSSLTVDSLVHGDEKVARLKEIIQPDMVVRSGKKTQLHNALVVQHSSKKLFEAIVVSLNGTK